MKHTSRKSSQTKDEDNGFPLNAPSDSRLLQAPSLWDVVPETEENKALISVGKPAGLSSTEIEPVKSFYDGTFPTQRMSRSMAEARFRRKILEEHLNNTIALDGLYARYGVQAHSGVVAKGEIIDGVRWMARHGDLTWVLPLDLPQVREKIQQAALQHNIPSDELDDEFLQVTIIDIVQHLVGPYAARVMHGLYQAANDCWRTPLLSVDLNAFLTLLGRKPERRVERNGVGEEQVIGFYHRSDARAQLYQTLLALESVQLIYESRRRRQGDGEPVFHQIKRPLVRIMEADFLEAENPNGERKHPSTITLALGWYSGVRQIDGSPGKDYVRHERLRPGLGNAHYHRTDEALRRRLLLMGRYRLDKQKHELDFAPETIVLEMARKTALERAGITTENVTWQKKTLIKALEKLKASGLVANYSDIPKHPNDLISITIFTICLQGIELATEDEDQEEQEEQETSWQQGTTAVWPPTVECIVDIVPHARYASESTCGSASAIMGQMMQRLRGTLNETQLLSLSHLKAQWVLDPTDERPAIQCPPRALVLVTTLSVSNAELVQRRYLRDFSSAISGLKLQLDVRIEYRAGFP